MVVCMGMVRSRQPEAVVRKSLVLISISHDAVKPRVNSAGTENPSPVTPEHHVRNHLAQGVREFSYQSETSGCRLGM